MLLLWCYSTLIISSSHAVMSSNIFIRDGFVKHLVTFHARCESDISLVSNEYGVWSIVDDDSDLSHDSLVEMDLIEHVMKLFSSVSLRTLRQQL
jgi:hypothetical protein